MIFNKTVLNLFGSRTAVKVLETLANHEGMFSGRALARMAGINHQACLNELRKLRDLGVIKDAGQGRNVLFFLNRENMVVKEAVLPVFTAEKRIISELARDIKKIKTPGIVSIILFGSVAKGSDDAGSDIDILVVVNEREDNLKVADEISLNETDFVKKYGNVLSPVIMSRSEFKSGFRNKNSLITDIIKTGRTIAGKDISELII